jgi:hypothetical protein
VERALSEDRSLVITWVNRGTLHLVAAEDEPLLHVLRTPQLHNESERRLRVEGIDGATAERAVAGIVRGLSDGPLTRRQIRELLDRAGVPTAGLAVAHVGAVDVARCARGSWRDRLRARAAGRWSGRAAPGLECGKG